jgi:nucleotide-binding universal stress UspA family protein
MKSFLVPVGGSDSDESVLETALAAARPFGAHLQFLHVRIGVASAAQNTPHVEFASGAALREAMGELEMQSAARSAGAVRHVQEFCARSMVELCDTPGRQPAVTASCRQEEGDALERIIAHARHNDLVIVGRADRPNGLPRDFLERLVLDAGRPILIAGPTSPKTMTGTVMVCWRESADAARAVTAASPFLVRAERVIFASVTETDNEVGAGMNDVAAQFAWNAMPSEVQIIKANGRPPQELLTRAAQNCSADLIVMGAYGHSHLRESLFGGCTQSFLHQADRPILLMH